jgi:hypothetical protein
MNIKGIKHIRSHPTANSRSERKDLHIRERCPFFDILRIVICSEEIGDEELNEPAFKRKACCLHPRSKHRVDLISSSVTCKGYLEHCDVQTSSIHDNKPWT